jgi:hypothetical protein
MTLDAIAVVVAHRCPARRHRWTEFDTDDLECPTSATTTTITGGEA